MIEVGSTSKPTTCLQVGLIKLSRPTVTVIRHYEIANAHQVYVNTITVVSLSVESDILT